MISAKEDLLPASGCRKTSWQSAVREPQPIREALRSWLRTGVVVEIPNKGVFVKEFTARDIEEIFDLRVLLEDYAISKLQHHLTTADMQQLIDCLNEMERLHAQKDCVPTRIWILSCTGC